MSFTVICAGYSISSFKCWRKSYSLVFQANILIDGKGVAMLADFGLAEFSDAIATSGSSRAWYGSIRYMAPELLDPTMIGRAKPKKTFATDVYAFACVCYEVRLTFEFPRISRWRNWVTDFHWMHPIPS
jgi:serine/threonine protein kinase